MMTANQIHSKFILGPLQPIPGLEGERLIVSGSHIGVVSSSEGRWMRGTEIKKLNLPQVNTKFARWTSDGREIGVGTGKITVDEAMWKSFPKLTQLDEYAPPGVKHTTISSVCWNDHVSYAIVVVNTIDEAGTTSTSKEIRLFDANQNTFRFTRLFDQLGEAIIVGDHVVELTETITVLNFSGEEIAKLPVSRTRPYRVSWDLESMHMAILDHDWHIRLVNLEQWKVIAEWKGMFKDVSIHRDHLIALDLENQLHAACIQSHTLEAKGIVATGLLVNQIAIGEDDHLYLMGSGPVAVHKTRYSISCTE
ncbi:MAG TPA: hypothetical protein VGK46_10750 [Saprospiraceae bacterium]